MRARSSVVAVGAGVTRTRVGDRVLANVFPRWHAGPFRMETAQQLGGSLDGLLTEEALPDEEALVPAPAHLSFEEALRRGAGGVRVLRGGGRVREDGDRDRLTIAACRDASPNFTARASPDADASFELSPSLKDWNGLRARGGRVAAAHGSAPSRARMSMPERSATPSRASPGWRVRPVSWSGDVAFRPTRDP
jgi:hypothetical protein